MSTAKIIFSYCPKARLALNFGRRLNWGAVRPSSSSGGTGPMVNRASLSVFLLLCSTALAQVMSLPASNAALPGSLGITSNAQFGNDLWAINGLHSPLETPGGSLSKLDLKAPGKARREYEKGYQLLLRKDFPGAVEHLKAATSIYPSFVAAHNALGSAYLSLGQNDQARAEFAQAVALDDHLPTSYLNLGCAELALQKLFRRRSRH